MRPCKIQFIFYCHSIDTIIFNFLWLLDPQPKAKKTHQTQLSDGVGCSLIFFCFSPTILCMSWKSKRKGLYLVLWKSIVPIHIAPRIKGYWTIVQMFWYAGAVGFQMVGLKKNKCAPFFFFFFCTLISNVGAVGLSWKPKLYQTQFSQSCNTNSSVIDSLID